MTEAEEVAINHGDAWPPGDSSEPLTEPCPLWTVLATAGEWLLDHCFAVVVCGLALAAGLVVWFGPRVVH